MHSLIWRFKKYVLIIIAGGCAAQEVIKIITKQYVPLDNTFIYNAMQSTSSSFKMTRANS